MNDAIRMQLSAYVDGELPENEEELLLRRLSQDAELRQEVAEYLALGRLLRAEPGLAGADRLHERVAAELGERRIADNDDDDIPAAARRVRPLAGMAIAATVALVAIFALQQENPVDSDVRDATVADSSGDAVVVPEAQTQQELNLELLHKHADATSQLGDNGMGSRLVTLEFSEEVEAADGEDEAEDEAETEEPVTQP